MKLLMIDKQQLLLLGDINRFDISLAAPFKFFVRLCFNFFNNRTK